MSVTNDQVAPRGVPASSLAAARSLAEGSGPRKEIPVRRAFVNALENPKSGAAPLAQLVARGGRGGLVPLKLYLALIWRCAAEPFSTVISARKWAELLALPDPETLGARRIAKALDVLEDLELVTLTRRRGNSTRITLLDESGTGEPYTLPIGRSGKYTYFKVPTQLWVEGYIQEMSASGLAMLLVLLEGRNRGGEPTWWSTNAFPSRYGLTSTVRSRGTSELVRYGLLSVNKRAVSDIADFRALRVRNTYQLVGPAKPAEKPKSDRKPDPKPEPKPEPKQAPKAYIDALGSVGGGNFLASVLTPKEMLVLAKMSEGLTNREIADRMDTSENMVKNTVSNILEKLGVQRRTQAALMGAAAGLLNTPGRYDDKA